MPSVHNRDLEELEQFAFVATHDLQEPIRKIILFSHMMKENSTEKLGPQSEQYAQKIIDTAKQMNELVKNISNFARAGQRQLADQTIDFDELWEDVLDGLGQKYDLKTAHITLTGLPPAIRGNPLLLYQLFFNLLSNALTYRDRETSHISVSAESQEGNWVFRIQDDGIGIPLEMQEKVFEPFFRLHPRSKFPGAGIGLSICRRIAQRYGGQIWVEKTENNKGTLVCFHLPMTIVNIHDE